MIEKFPNSSSHYKHLRSKLRYSVVEIKRTLYTRRATITISRHLTSQLDILDVELSQKSTCIPWSYQIRCLMIFLNYVARFTSDPKLKLLGFRCQIQTTLFSSRMLKKNILLKQSWLSGKVERLLLSNCNWYGGAV